VFTTASGTPLRHSNFMLRVWHPAVARAELPKGLRFHDLRYTCAALLIKQGVHPKAVQRHLGHTSFVLTMDRYGHLYDDDVSRVADTLDLAFQAVAEG
jgi:integrase